MVVSETYLQREVGLVKVVILLATCLRLLLLVPQLLTPLELEVREVHHQQHLPVMEAILFLLATE